MEFKLTDSFKRKIFWEGMEKNQAYPPAEADVICDSIEFHFGKHHTEVTLLQNGMPISEGIIPTKIYPGETFSIDGLKLYYTIHQKEGEDK